MRTKNHRPRLSVLSLFWFLWDVKEPHCCSLRVGVVLWYNPSWVGWVSSNSWFCIKCYWSLSMFCEFGNDGWNCVIEGRILLYVPNFCLGAFFLGLYRLFRVAFSDKACFELSNILLKHSFWRVCSFDKTLFNARWVTVVEACVLKCFKCFLDNEM